jgi:hypothetical protein
MVPDHHMEPTSSLGKGKEKSLTKREGESQGILSLNDSDFDWDFFLNDGNRDLS